MVATTVSGGSLSLHAGGNACDLATVNAVRTPASTHSFCPIPHAMLVEETRMALNAQGYSVTEEAHALWGAAGERYFGLLGLCLNGETDDGSTPQQFVLGLRNSHDKTFPASSVLGTRVFVCDNLAFTGSGIKFEYARKHTTHALRDLPRIIGDKMTGIHDARADVEHWTRRVQAWDFAIAEEENNIPARMLVNDFLLRGIRAGAFTVTQLPHIMHEFHRKDSAGGHADAGVAWARPTMWRMIQAVTEADKLRPSLLKVERNHARLTAVARHTMQHTCLGASDRAIPQYFIDG